MTITRAITRRPGTNATEGLTTSQLGHPDIGELLRQHEIYLTVLHEVGLDLTVLEADPAYPDGYFVEDVAVITPEVAVVTIPGAPSRQGEQDSVEPYLARFRQIRHITTPGYLEGGDVLVVDKHCFIGISDRTNMAGARQLGLILEEFQYSWETIDVGGGLHLKSSVNNLGQDSLLLTQAMANHSAFKRYSQIIVDEDEIYAANTLLINDYLIMPAGFPSTRQKIEALDRSVIEIDVSAIQAMDGGLTCMSLRL